MSKYTTELRFICEHLSGLDTSVGLNSVQDVVEKARTKIFDFAYPLFNPEHKKELETKIIRHYYTREICCETYGLWKMWLETRLNEIMPYYNELYKTAELEYNPLYDTDYYRDIDESKTGDSTENNTSNTVKSSTNVENKTGDVLTKQYDTGTVTNMGTNTGTVKNVENTTDNETSKNTDKYSDTPQGGLTGIENNNYLTNVRIVDGTKNGTGTVEGTRTDDLANSNTRTDDLERETTVTNDLLNTNTLNGNENSTNNGTAHSDDSRDYMEHVYGKMSGVLYSDMIKKYRDNILNIDLMIINELADLFFLLW